MSDHLTPETYPAECTISEEELRELHDFLTDSDNDHMDTYVEEWPPSDKHGNAYPIWFTVKDFDGSGKLRLDDDSQYSPFVGNLEPLDDDNRCNEPLDRWRDRYRNIRYCGQYILDEDDSPRCYLHRRPIMKTAEEALQTGLHTKTMDHLYEKVGPWKKLVGWGTFESLMGTSTYDFAVEYRERQFDFSEEPAEVRPADCDEDGVLTVKCGHPTEHLDPSMSLFVAAMMGVQMLVVQPRIMHENREEGEGMMESRTIETAQLTAPPSEHDPSPQEFKTLETWSEHHLNLPLSRLVSDRQTLLERGGVNVDPDGDDSDSVGDDDIVLEIEADADSFETTEDPSSPNSFEDQPITEEIKASVKDSEEESDG
jgi:hypothetical protein